MKQRTHHYLTRSPQFYTVIALLTILAVAAQGLLAVRPALASDPTCTLTAGQWTCRNEDQTTYQLSSEIVEVWEDQAGSEGWLGWPTGPETQISTGIRQQFQHGSIWWSPTTGTHAVGGAIGETWTTTGTGAGWMGFPTSDEYPAYSGQRQDFQFGSILWSPTTGSWTLGGAIGAHYKALGAQSSWLGFPIGREYAVGGSIQQDFQRGSIVWSPGQAATAVEGGKWIDVNLSNQTLTAFVGQSVAFGPVSISSGLVFRSSTGTFTVYAKRALQDMRGINPNGTTYVQPSVPWILYYNGGEALHGAYWHNNFGHPMSHGCINMRVEEARAIYNWAPVGTVVKVHY